MCHLTHDNSLLHSYYDVPKCCNSYVKIGNSDKSVIIGTGSVHLRTKDKNIMRICKLSNVLDGPDLDYNLVSISYVDKQGFTNFFSNSGCRLEHAGKTTATGSMLNEIYKLHIESHHKNVNSAHIA